MENGSRTRFAIEQREFQRKPVRWRVQLMLERQPPQLLTGRALDVSLGGMSVHCERNLAAGEVRLGIAIPRKEGGQGLQCIEVNAAVRNSVYSNDGFRIGLQFTQFHGRAKDLISSVLAS